jgi:hypothetical protein
LYRPQLTVWDEVNLSSADDRKIFQFVIGILAEMPMKIPFYGATTFSITSFSIMTFSITIFSITTFIITTLSI